MTATVGVHAAARLWSRRGVLSGFGGAVAALALGACVGAPPVGQAARLVVGHGTDPASLDPLLQTGLVEASVYANVCEPLVALDADGRLVPALATAYRAVDERTWEFSLRSGVRFQNGEPFDSASVRATIERVLDPATASPIRAQLEAIERVDTPDPLTARIVTREPFAPLLAELSGLMLLPPGWLASASAEERAIRPVGTGPYRVTEWQRAAALRLEAHAAWWLGGPRFRRVEFRPVPDAAQRVAALRTGDLDLAVGIPADLAETVSGPDVRLVERPGVQTLYLRLNARKPPLDDVRVRRALAHAVDVDGLIEGVYLGRARRVNGPFPPEVFGADAAGPLAPFDPARARALLAAAGFDPGLVLTLETPRGRYPGDDRVAEIVAWHLSEVGVRVDVQVVEWSSYLARLQAGQGGHLFLLAGTNRTFDPHFTIMRLYASASPFGRHYYGNERIDSLAREAAATLDPERRRPLYHRILTTLREDVPAIWIAQLADVYGLRRRLDWAPRADSLLLLGDARPAAQ